MNSHSLFADRTTGNRFAAQAAMKQFLEETAKRTFVAAIPANWFAAGGGLDAASWLGCTRIFTWIRTHRCRCCTCFVGADPTWLTHTDIVALGNRYFLANGMRNHFSNTIRHFHANGVRDLFANGVRNFLANQFFFHHTNGCVNLLHRFTFH